LKTKLIIFGAGKISESISYYFNRDSEYQIEAYVVDDIFASKTSFLEKPLVKLSEVEQKYPASEYKVFVATGYQGINKLRSSKFDFFKSKGYSFASYISPHVPGDFIIGENSIIMDNTTIQPCVKIGNNVLVWGGALIGHHADIKDHCWLTGGCLVGGIVTLGERTFVGLGAVLGNEIVVGPDCMIGASTLSTTNIEEGTVLLVGSTEAHRLNSAQFSRMSACFKM
jgi:sugar O-acyltransferase (sialic acid O-acetyltransferase NeuD family)